MKMAEIIPLYKGKESDKVINYRLISLLLATSKILEKIVHDRLINFITKHDILYDSQYGFHTKRSCEYAMLELIGNLLQSRNNKLHSTAIFLDQSKAFDTLNHKVFIKKLDRYGMRNM